MKMWRWFCGLGKKRKLPEEKKTVRPEASLKAKEAGVDICSRICGEQGCKCGSTARGYYCIWSYYRLE